MNGFKPHRAKCHECGNGMIKKSNTQKYCASCRRTVMLRQNHESKVRNGRIKNPGAGSERNNWKGGGRAWQIKNFRGTECERCGSEGKMHLHHRDRVVAHWKNGNLETLCVPCHHEEHKVDGGLEHYAAA